MSLVWRGSELLDPVKGWTRFALDGRVERGHVFYAFPFDRAVISPSQRFTVLYTVLGTTGLLLDGDQLIRQLHRDYYFAHWYEYPIAFLQLPDGREVVVHCPDAYNLLQFEVADSGERLTQREGHGQDVFHSRLAVSADNRFLLSAGLLWHPWDVADLFSVEEALREPASLDGRGIGFNGWLAGYVESAAFRDNDHVFVAMSFRDERFDEGDPDPNPDLLGPRELGVWSIPEGRWTSRVELEEPPGTIMPVGNYMVGFYQYPKLFDVRTGRVVERWPHINSGTQHGSILINQEPPLPIALDPRHRRFAVATHEAIEIVQLAVKD